ncbi:MAG: hypothetical protein VB108_04090 [Anaerolineaceae bacterium]|nr:hypothetical protein [Anaerolineaceae bacterium]
MDKKGIQPSPKELSKSKVINRTISYYKPHIISLVLLAGFVLSFVGTWQAYSPQFSGFKLLLVMVYDTLKLFSFAGMIPITTQGPLPYELARWLAPLGTVLGFFAIFDRFIKRFFTFFTRFRRKSYLLLGWNEESKLFAAKLLNQKSPPEVICIHAKGDTTISDDELHDFGLNSAFIDYEFPSLFANILTIRSLVLKKPSALISFEPEPANFGHLKVLSDLLPKRNTKLEVYVSYKNHEMKEFLRDSLDALENMNIHYFNTDELVAIDLVNQKGFPIHESLLFRQSWQKEDLYHLGHANVLIFGFSSLAQRLVELVINQACIDLKDQPRFTLVDAGLGPKLEQFRGFVKTLDDLSLIHPIEGDLFSKSVMDQIRQLDAEEPFTSIVYTSQEAEKGILHLLNLFEGKLNTPAAFYAPQTSKLLPMMNVLKSKGSDVYFFGELAEILSPERIFNEVLYQKALKLQQPVLDMQHTNPYLGASEGLLEVSAKRQNAFEREAQLYLSISLPVKRAILEKYSQACGMNQNELSAAWADLLSTAPSAAPAQVIAGNKDMRYLAELEQKRAENFIQLRGFAGMQSKEKENAPSDQFFAKKENANLLNAFAAYLAVLKIR